MSIDPLRSPSLSVIIPTKGRKSLDAAIASCAGADQIVVVADEAAGALKVEIEMVPGITLAAVKGGDHGYTARTVGMQLATSSHLAFLDDDDVFAPGAIETMRSVESNVPVIFKMDHPTHGVLWREPVLAFGNVGTPMFLVPNDPENFGVWKPYAPGLPEPGGDFTFIAGCVEKMGGVRWEEAITSWIRPGPTVTVVTPWYEHEELWPDYQLALSVLRSFDRLCIVDNGSQPELEFATVRLGENAGFSWASNYGLDNADTDAVLFLNNDIVASSPEWLMRLRDGIAKGVLTGAKLRFDQHSDVGKLRLPYLDGWCLAGMTEDLLALGGFDTTYQEPAYYVDNDLCLRARVAGMSLREARIGLGHKVGRTAGLKDSPSKIAAIKVNQPKYAKLAREVLAA